MLISPTEFEERLCLARNMAFPDSSLDIPVGPVYRFSPWYLVEVDNPCAMFRHGTGRGMRVTLWPPLLTCEQGLLACPTAEDRGHAPGSIWHLAKPCSSEPRCGRFSAHSDRKTGGGLEAWQVYCLASWRRVSGLNPLAVLHADQTLCDEVPQA